MGISVNACLAFGCEITVDLPDDIWEDFDDLQEYLDDLMKDAVEENACAIEVHGRGDSPMYFLCIESTVTDAWSGSPQKIDSMEIEPWWYEQIKIALEKLGNDPVPENKVGWHIFSYMG